MSYAHLPSLLRRTSWLTLTLEVVRALCGTVCVLLAAVLAALAIDAVLGLYPSGLIAVDLLLVGLLARDRGLCRPPNVAEPVQSCAGWPVKSKCDWGSSTAD